MTDSVYFEDTSRVKLAGLLGRGGEGTVYAIESKPKLVAKIYHGFEAGREKKLKSIIASKLSSSTGAVAFPRALLFDAQGRVCGFSMQRVDHAKPLHELYSPAARKINFPTANYKFLVRTAQNIVKAVAEVHHLGCVVGDINHSSILIGRDAKVTLIDTDSFQLGLVNPSFRCIVGVPEYTAPELQGKSFRSVDRTVQSDLFATAIIIYQLLQLGQHPFVGVRPEGPVALDEAIRDYSFAQARQRNDSLKPPPSSIYLSSHLDVLTNLFEKTFSREYALNRPALAEWLAALGSTENALQTCEDFSTHTFPPKLTECPWCSYYNRTGIQIFQHQAAHSETSTELSDYSLNIETLMNNVAPIPTFDLAQVVFKLPETFNDTVTAEKYAAKGALRVLWLLLLAAPLLALAIDPNALLFSTLVACFGLFKFLEKKNSPIRTRHANLREFENSVREWLQTTGIQGALQSAENIKFLNQQCRNIVASKSARIEMHVSRLKARELTLYLSNFLVSKAKITGIGPSKLAELISYGIETAADCDYTSLTQVPGIGPVTANNILKWKEAKEKRFVPIKAPSKLKKQASDQVARELSGLLKELQTLRENEVRSLKKASANIPSGTILMPERMSEQFAKVLGLANASTPIAPTIKFGTILKTYGLSSIQQSFVGFRPSPHIARKLQSITDRFKPSTKSKPATTTTTAKQAAAPISGSKKCPACGSSMILRTAKRGARAGNKFYGCSRFPKCRGTRSI